MRARTLNRKIVNLKRDNSLKSIKEKYNFFGYRMISNVQKGRINYLTYEMNTLLETTTMLLTVKDNKVINEKELI